MGNNLEKVFHDDEYEVTVRIRKRDRGGAENAAAAAAPEAAAVPAAAVNGGREEAAATPAIPNANGSNKVRKNTEDGSTRARKVFKPGPFEEANSSDSEQQQQHLLALEEATPRSRYAGRKTSCMKWGDGGLDMTVLKSHLSPNFHVTVPPEFVDLHGSSFEITNGQRGKSLEIEAVNRTRFKFKKQNWAAIVHEHSLQLNDTIFFRLESKGRFRVEKGPPVVPIATVEPSASPPPFPTAGGGAAEMCSPGATDSAGAATSMATPAAAAAATPAVVTTTTAAAKPAVATTTTPPPPPPPAAGTVVTATGFMA